MKVQKRMVKIEFTYIDKYPQMQLCTPCRSSWGANGYSEVWLNQSNDYVHRHLHVAGDKMVELANLCEYLKLDFASYFKGYELPKDSKFFSGNY